MSDVHPVLIDVEQRLCKIEKMLQPPKGDYKKSEESGILLPPQPPATICDRVCRIEEAVEKLAGNILPFGTVKPTNGMIMFVPNYTNGGHDCWKWDGAAWFEYPKLELALVKKANCQNDKTDCHCGGDEVKS